MNIGATQYSLNKKQFEIYLSGCDGYCDKKNKEYLNDIHARCHNPELWDFNYGKEWKTYIPEITRKINKYNKMISSIAIFGGEPLLQPKEDLLELLKFLYSFNIDLWLFTRFDFTSIDEEVLKYLTYVKCGFFDYSMKTNENIQYGFSLASTNQKIIKLK